MKKSTKVIVASIVAFILAAAVAIGIVVATGTSETPAPTKAPVAVATETPAPAETAIPDPEAGEEVMGFDEFSDTYTESSQFAADESTVVKAGSITKDCGAEPVAFEGEVLAGYTVTFSDEAHTTPIDIACEFTASTEAYEDAGFEGLE